MSCRSKAPANATCLPENTVHLITDDKQPTLRDTPPRSSAGRALPPWLSRCAAPLLLISSQAVQVWGSSMKKIIASLVTAAVALVSVQAFAQASDAAPAAASTAKPKHPHKQLKTHGKRANVSSAASAAGTNDKGQPN